MPAKSSTNLFLTFFIFLLSVCYSTAQEDLTISSNYTVPEGETEEYNNITLDKNTSNLVVNGTLIVYGNLDMKGNDSQFSMGDNATVIVYGDFLASNKVDVSVKSYLIIQGSFIRQTGSDQFTLDLDSSNIYIFGEVEGWAADFSSCDNYAGDTTGITNTDCEYGTADNFEDNIESFPPAIAEELNCFNIINPIDQSSCPGSDVIFNSGTTTTKLISYQWQVKITGSDSYEDIPGATAKDLTLNNITNDMSGNLYRLKVKAADTDSGCKVSISQPATLLIETIFDWTGVLGSDWNNPGNWLCDVIPNTSSNVSIPSGLANYPVISSGASALVNNLNIESGASLEISGNILEVYGAFSGTGKINASAGTLVLKGSTSQTLASGLFINDRILNLEVDNSDQVISNTNIELTGWLKLTSGDLLVNNNFTLVSDATQTALIDGAGTGNIIGSINIQRFIDPAFGYKYFGSPFSNTIVGDFANYIDLNSQFPSVFNYNESREDTDGNDISGWESYTNPSSSFNVMEGYALNFGTGGGSATIDINGTINTGDLSRSLNTSNGTFTKGFHLVSNPYPSPINWNLVPGLSTNLDAAAYFFRADATDEYGGAYTSYVADISSSGSSGSIIPSMQGFFVHASDGSTNSLLNMNNSVRVNDFSQEFYKDQENPEKRSLLRISAGFEDQTFSDPLVIYFENGSSMAFEKSKDALKLYNSNKNLPNFFSITSDGKESSINGIPKPEAKDNDRIPLGIKTEKSGMLVIQSEDLENFPANNNLFLIDQQRRVSVNLKNENYKFFLEKGEYKNRFFLSFLSAEFRDPAILFNDPFSLMNASEEIGIRMNLKENESGQLRISTINGQLLKLVNVSANQELNFSEIKSTGIYLVSFISNERQFTKKVIVRK